MNRWRIDSRLPRRTLLFTAGALLLLSFFTSLYFHEVPSLEREQRHIEEHLHSAEADFAAVIAERGLVQRLALRQETEAEFNSLQQKKYGLYLYDAAGTLLYWNNQRSLPTAKDIRRHDGHYAESLPNGFYIILKRSVPIPAANRSITAIAMVPILYTFDYQHSSYLRTSFAHDADAVRKIRIAATRTPYAIRDRSTLTLFHIEAKPHSPDARVDAVSAILRIMAFLLLLAFIHFLAEDVTRKRGALRGIAFLLVVLVAVRVLLLFVPALFSFRQFTLFDPAVYSNYHNPLFRSLGDLLISTLFACWLIAFTWWQMGPQGRLPRVVQGRYKLWAGVIALFVLMFTTFQFANVVRSLVADSSISFNVTYFFSLDVFTVVGFVELALLTVSYYYFTRVLYRFIFPAFAGRMLLLYFGLAGIGLLFLTLRSGNAIVLFHLPVLLWLLCYTLLVSREQFLVNRFRITMAGVLFWIFVFSISLAIIILGENREKELRMRKAIAEKYHELTEPTGERTLSIALAYLDNDFLRGNFRRFFRPTESNLLRDSIISENITGYLNKYQTRIFVFDGANNPVNNPDPVTYGELNNLFTVQSKPTGVPDLSYFETSFDQFTYITKRNVTDSLGVIGTFFIVSTPRKYNSEALYPELFRRINESDEERSPIYAIYKNRLLVGSSSKYSFKINLTGADIPLTEFERRITPDYDELWYRASSSKVVVIAKKRDTLIESITLFSYLFCAFLFLVSVLRLVTLLLRHSENWRGLPFWQLNIRTQVHGTIIFISIFSFLVIGVATISFFIARYQRNNIDRLSRTAGIVVREMQQRVLTGTSLMDGVQAVDSTGSLSLQRLINEIAEIHNVDVNLYDPSGDLRVSSEPEVYKRGLLSTRMHPVAYHHLNRLREVQYVQEERLSSLRYLSIYAAIRNEKGEVYAYLNIPYFLSQIDVNQEISNFLVTIINLNAFIFLIAGIIALIITNRITRSFSLIGEKMRDISLGRRNEEIEWHRNDEIGELVQQYNKMVRQLEESADALARSEREGAWREMARQVAHEIKNPLTPMKLSIQYLQRAVATQQPNVEALTTSVTKTLIEQIDHLAKISSDFARFANIGNRNLEEFDLHEVLMGLQDLHATNPKITLTWNRADGPARIVADKTHMNRLFTNLLTNAVEACSAQNECRLELNEVRTETTIRVEVRDNGEGIPEEMQGRIFTPNFTTKSSGTGLGLAMSKSIVEQAGGRIWFETERGKGTSFFVELPLKE
ncbi:HAMP domain-containing sensor histidine kinase [Flaviaesturariibacter amylovorans]|uniref:histidine kinase n=1 Tax=Flaviaesturariibacter amylovorans TaxID=1084520 RepID=A0ABP8GZN1_9BACT